MYSPAELNNREYRCLKAPSVKNGTMALSKRALQIHRQIGIQEVGFFKVVAVPSTHTLFQ